MPSLRSGITSGLGLCIRPYRYANQLVRRYFFLLKFCTEVLLIISNKILQRLIEKQCHIDVITKLDAPFRISAVSRTCCHGNMNNPILLKFGIKVQLSISNKITKLCWDWLRNDVTVTSLLFWRTQSFLSTLTRKCCCGNSKAQRGYFHIRRSAARIHTQSFTFKQIPIYFREKSPNVVELSFSLPELWARNLKGGAEYLRIPADQDGS